VAWDNDHSRLIAVRVEMGQEWAASADDDDSFAPGLERNSEIPTERGPFPAMDCNPISRAARIARRNARRLRRALIAKRYTPAG
jgi:hypothetical protein